MIMCGGLGAEPSVTPVPVVVSRSKDPGINGDDPDPGVEPIPLLDMEIFLGTGCLAKVRLEGEMGDCPGGLYGEGEEGRWTPDMAPVTGGEADPPYMFAS